MIIVGVGGQLSWYFFGVIPKTQASFQEMQNVSGFIMIIGFLILPAGLFKDGLPSPGAGAKVFLGIILIVFLGIGLTSVLLIPSAQGPTVKCTPTTCGYITILPGSANAGISSAITFSPRVITVDIGINNTVIWTNDDTAGHTVRYINGTSGPSSPVFTHGQTYEYTFDKAGTYDYYCTIHTFMMGEVIVVTP